MKKNHTTKVYNKEENKDSKIEQEKETNMPRMINLSRVYGFISQTYNEVMINVKDYLSREPQLPIFNNISLTFKIVAALLGFLQLMPHSPFETHPKTVFVAVVNLVMFWVSCDAEERLTYTNTRVHMINIARHGRIVFATLLVASLTSILVPSMIQPMVYLVFIMYYGHEWIYWLYKRIMDEVVLTPFELTISYIAR